MRAEPPSSSPSPSTAPVAPQPADTEPTLLTAEELSAVLDVTLRLGRVLAVAGAATFRVRDAMRRAAGSFGVTRAELTCNLDALHATLHSGPLRQTAVSRVPALGVDMSRICRIVTLTRRLAAHPGERTPADLERELDAIEATPSPYPTWTTPVFLGLSCAAFCGVIGGSPWQMVAAFAGTFAGHLLRLHHLRYHPPVATVVVTCAFTSAFVAWAAARGLGFAATALAVDHTVEAFGPGKALLASVLYLIPGVPLVQSLIDVLHHDLTAGLARSAHASLVLVCIAIGVLAFLSLTGFALV